MARKYKEIFPVFQGEPQYVSQFFFDLAKIFNVNPTVIETLYVLNRHAIDGQIHLTIQTKNDACKELKLFAGEADGNPVPNVNIIDQRIGQLVKSGLLTKLKRAVYRPHELLNVDIQEDELSFEVFYTAEGIKVKLTSPQNEQRTTRRSTSRRTVSLIR